MQLVPIHIIFSCEMRINKCEVGVRKMMNYTTEKKNTCVVQAVSQIMIYLQQSSEQILVFYIWSSFSKTMKTAHNNCACVQTHKLYYDNLPQP